MPTVRKARKVAKKVVRRRGRGNLTNEECGMLMRAQEIFDQGGYRKWALKNHPDKGGSTARFQQVSDCKSRGIYGVVPKPTFGSKLVNYFR